MQTLIPLIQGAGYLGIFGAIFAESGLLIGVILPGDTLLFASGLLASRGFLNITVLLVGSTLAAILGDSVGYWMGKKFGPRIFNREDSFFFKKAYVARAESFFKKYGKNTIFLSRYVPIVRTIVPILAGVGNMPYKTFITYNIIGGITWCVSLLLLGYFLGTTVPNIDAYILPIVGFIFVISLIPLIRQFVSHKREHN